MNMKKGFTLAEVLVTLGIIGVVSALTMPVLINSYQKRVYITALHKAYNEVNQALTQKLTDSNTEDLSEAGLTTQDALDTWVENYFKYTQKCNTAGSMEPCFAPLTNYNKLKNNTSGNNLDITPTTSYLLASSFAIMFKSDVVGNKLFDLIIDTNGSNKPNILGRDLFVIAIYKNGKMDDYSSETDDAPLTIDQRNTAYANCTSQDNKIWGCFGKILTDNWQMNY